MPGAIITAISVICGFDVGCCGTSVFASDGEGVEEDRPRSAANRVRRVTSSKLVMDGAMGIVALVIKNLLPRFNCAGLALLLSVSNATSALTKAVSRITKIASAKVIRRPEICCRLTMLSRPDKGMQI